MGIEKFEDGVECHTDEYGNKRWYKNDELHRDGDLPAVEWADY